MGTAEGIRLCCGNSAWIVQVPPGCLNGNHFNGGLIKAVVSRLKSVLLQFPEKILAAEVECYLPGAGGFEWLIVRGV